MSSTVGLCSRVGLHSAIRIWASLVRPHSIPLDRRYPSSEQNLLEMGRRVEQVQRSKHKEEGKPYLYVSDHLKQATERSAKGGSTGNLHLLGEHWTGGRGGGR